MRRNWFVPSVLALSLSMLAFACSAGNEDPNEPAPQEQTEPGPSGGKLDDPDQPSDEETEESEATACWGSKLFIATAVGYHSTSTEKSREDACWDAKEKAEKLCKDSTWLCYASPEKVIGGDNILYCNYAGDANNPSTGTGWYCKCQMAVSCKYSF